MEVLTNLIVIVVVPFCNIHIYLIIILYILNLHVFINQKHLSKAGIKRKKKENVFSFRVAVSVLLVISQAHDTFLPS